MHVLKLDSTFQEYLKPSDSLLRSTTMEWIVMVIVTLKIKLLIETNWLLLLMRYNL